MQGDAQSIQYLNRILYNELRAINQYFLHSRMLGDWGLAKLEAYEYGQSLGEMRHADKLTQRILFLEGLPNYQDLGRLYIGEDVPDILACDHKLELETIKDLSEAVAHTESVGDYVSRDLLQTILDAEEEHVDWLETQFGLIERMGPKNYLQSQI